MACLSVKFSFFSKKMFFAFSLKGENGIVKTTYFLRRKCMAKSMDAKKDSKKKPAKTAKEKKKAKQEKKKK